jgi:type III pantothenate kinase
LKKKLQTTTKVCANLIIDYGNTFVKAAIFENGEPLEVITKPHLEDKDILRWKQKYTVQNAILSAVRDVPEEIKNYLKEKFHFLELTHLTPVPVKNLYETPETLGRDRLAAVVAGHDLLGTDNVLVIDAGTCITFDFVDSQGVYHGGGITPGIQMRFNALHTFTARLPLLTSRKIGVLSGTSTEESILSGVLNGVVAEIDGIIENYMKQYPGLQIIVTGGDVDFFAEKLKSNIFATQNLVLKGLNKILQFNVEEEQKRN